MQSLSQGADTPYEKMIRAVGALLDVEMIACKLDKAKSTFEHDKELTLTNYTKRSSEAEKRLHDELERHNANFTQAVSGAVKDRDFILEACRKDLAEVEDAVERSLKQAATYAEANKGIRGLTFAAPPAIVPMRVTPNSERQSVEDVTKKLLEEAAASVKAVEMELQRRPKTLQNCVVAAVIGGLVGCFVIGHAFLWGSSITILGLGIPFVIMHLLDRRVLYLLSTIKSDSESLGQIGRAWIEQVKRDVNARMSEAKLNCERLSGQAETLRTDKIRDGKEKYNRDLKAVEAERDRDTQIATDVYSNEVATIRQEVEGKVAQARKLCYSASQGLVASDWNGGLWSEWNGVTSVANAARIGVWSVPMQSFRRWFLSHGEFAIPALVPFAGGKSITIRGGTKGTANLELVRTMLYRLLATCPAGMLRFMFIDPVSIGDSVAALIRLRDYDERLISTKAWTESRDIEKRLEEISTHMTDVIQARLRDQYKDIEAYNAEATVPEPYRVLVIFDFPAGFTDTMVARLRSIIRNGPRCGVFAILSIDGNRPLPHGVCLDELLEGTIPLEVRGDGVICHVQTLDHAVIKVDPPPADALLDQIIVQIGEGAKAGMRVEVDFDRMLEMTGLGNERGRWNKSSANGLEVALGPMGVSKTQKLLIGSNERPTENHVILLGTNGSGKSNLMHVIVSGLCLDYSPEELELYLIDLKEGVEFKPYVDGLLPHASVIGIESEREFVLSALSRLSGEIDRRADLFKKANAPDLLSYRSSGSAPKLPRILAVIDEFQELFIKDDKIARDASDLLEKLVRKGRSYGLHLLLGSQTLAGSSDLSRAILSQINIRIVLKCDIQDATKLLGEETRAVRLISRPGEGIYFVMREVSEDSRFQTAYLRKEQKTELIAWSRTRAASIFGSRFADSVVFEGNQRAEIERSKIFKRTVEDPPQVRWAAKDTGAWLGERLEIGPPIRALFRRQSGSHLLVVCRDENKAMGVVSASIVSLAVQTNPVEASFFIFDSSLADGEGREVLNEMSTEMPHFVSMVEPAHMEEKLLGLYKDMQARFESYDGKAQTFLVFAGLQRNSKVHPEETSIFASDREKTAAVLLQEILRDGGDYGFHVIAQVDTFSNVERCLGMGGHKRFGLKAVSGTTDSESLQLIGDVNASSLKNREHMVFFDEEESGASHKFRPYVSPDRVWLKEVMASLDSGELAVAP